MKLHAEGTVKMVQENGRTDPKEMTIEKLRASFRPENIRVMFVGESAPCGGAFFYKGNTGILCEIRKAFGGRFEVPAGSAAFLDWFKANGFYLDDLVLTPINKKKRRERTHAACSGIEQLSVRIRKCRPQLVIAIMRSIEEPVRAALTKSGVPASYYCVPFPGNGQQRRFQAEMRSILETIKLPETHRDI